MLIPTGPFFVEALGVMGRKPPEHFSMPCSNIPKEARFIGQLPVSIRSLFDYYVTLVAKSSVDSQLVAKKCFFHHFVTCMMIDQFPATNNLMYYISREWELYVYDYRPLLDEGENHGDTLKASFNWRQKY
ncbi:MAG: hypothetical protein WDZ88_02590 [Candidatus Paceibacterota bacterium]